MRSEARDKKLNAIVEWSQQNDDIICVLLTSSLVNPLAPVDAFSDLDIELIFEENSTYANDNSWLDHFGAAIAIVEEDESCFEGRHAMKMVLYDDYVKVDFKLYSQSGFLKEVRQDELCEDWDIGYKVLVDKTGITRKMLPPTHQVSIIRMPEEKEFRQVLNDFWWDTTYVAKSLARDNIFYAKFMSEDNIRTGYIVPLLEWHIASQHDWSVTTNKHGRFFKQYLSPEMWAKAMRTFSAGDLDSNWKALFAMADLVTEIGTSLAINLNYNYPEKLDKDIRQYLSMARNLSG